MQPRRDPLDMSFITRFSLDTSRVTLVVLVLIVLAGLRLFFVFPRQEDPTIVIREIVVTAYFPGMEPRDVEALITRQLETQLRTLPEIDEIWSESKTGVAVVHADTRDEYDELDTIWQKVRNKMADIQPDLPQGTVGPFVDDEVGLTAIATIALWSDGFSLAEARRVARDIRDELYELKGMRKAELYGVQDEQIFLKFSTTKLSQYQTSIQDILRTLTQQNIILPGGRIAAGYQDVLIEPSGNFRTVEDIEHVLISIPGTEHTTRLKDLLEVRRGYIDPPHNLAYFNGKPCIVLSVSVIPGVNIVEFGERLTRKLRDIERRLPLGYVLEYATFQPDLVVTAVNRALSNVYQTLGIVLVVVMLFLGVRTGLIVGSFVPLTMLLGLIGMSLIDIALERVSIAATIIALGMLVDNGVVVAEDIRTRMQQGQTTYEACVAAGRTLSVPLLTSSLTSILAFMPMLFLEGAAGEYTFSLPAVVTILLGASWFLSMYMTPAMSLWFMKTGDAPHEPADPYAGRVYRRYRRLLHSLLRHRTLVLLLAGGTLIGGFLLPGTFVREFFGSSDRNQFLVYVDLPAGAKIEATAAAVQRLSTWLADKRANPEVTGAVAYIGTGGPRFFLSLGPINPDPNHGFLVVNTETGEQTPRVVERTRQYFADAMPEAEGRVKRMWLGASEPGYVEIRLIGPDPEHLHAKGRQLVAGLKALPGTLDVRHDWENKVLKFLVVVDQARARRAGITSQDVAVSLEAHLDGVRATDYREGDVAIPVVFQAVDEERRVFGDLWNINVYSTSRGVTVPLTQIASFDGRWEFGRIARRNQEMVLSVGCRHEYLKAPELLTAVRPLVDALNLESGFRWEVGGEVKNAGEANEKLFRYLPPCFLGIIVLLIWQFNSFRRPLIILLTIPLAFVGAFIGIFVFQAPFDFFGILGLLSLGGVIINHGIVLIERIDTEQRAGRAPYDAILAAALSRLRPINMTTITTALGVMPLIISADPLFYSLAIIIAFGLAFGTVLTLGLVPVLYAALFRVQVPDTPAAA